MIIPPEGVAPKLASGQVASPWAEGTFTCEPPIGTGRLSRIVVCKLGWWTGAPWDVRAYALGHSTYPTDSTLEQLYDSAEFDAYRELGAASVRLTMQQAGLLPPPAAGGPAAPAAEGLGPPAAEGADLARNHVPVQGNEERPSQTVT
jgi:hypothetical protein